HRAARVEAIRTQGRFRCVLLDCRTLGCASSESGGNPAMALRPTDNQLGRRMGVGLRLASFWVVAVVPCVLIAFSAGYGQAPGSRIIYSRQPNFWIPFETDAGERRLQEV